MEEEGDISAELAAQRSQKELDDEIKKRKERQVESDNLKTFCQDKYIFRNFTMTLECLSPWSPSPSLLWLSSPSKLFCSIKR